MTLTLEEREKLERLLRGPWDTLTREDFMRQSHPAARLCPLCGAWCWSEDKHRQWHVDAGK